MLKATLIRITKIILDFLKLGNTVRVIDSMRTFLKNFHSDGVKEKRMYWLSVRLNVRWNDAKTLCKSYGLELLHLESKDEMNYFIKACNQYKNLFGDYTFVDGVTDLGKSKTEWFYSETGRKVSFALPWLPGTPDNVGSDEHCLSIAKAQGTFLFNDVNCDGTKEGKKFLCLERSPKTG